METAANFISIGVYLLGVALDWPENVDGNQR